MVEKDTVFDSKIKYEGVFDYKNFYKFCYDWLLEEVGLDLSEKEYSEKIKGPAKEVNIKWEGTKKVTDYFKFVINVNFQIINLVEVEITQNGNKIKTNKGEVKVSVKGVLEKDYEGKFETNAQMKFLRSIYEKWIIPSRVIEFEDKLAGKCDEFMLQSRSFLDLEGKR